MKRIKQNVPTELMTNDPVVQLTPQSGMQIVSPEAEIHIIDDIQKELVKPYDSEKLEAHLKGFNTLFHWELQRTKEKAAQRFVTALPEDKSGDARKKHRTFFMYAVGVQLALLAITTISIYYRMALVEPVAVTASATEMKNVFPGINQIMEPSAPVSPVSSITKPAAHRAIKRSIPAPAPAPAAVQAPIYTKPYTFNGFFAENITTRGASFKWVDSDINACSYMLESSTDGHNFEIQNIIDGIPGTQPTSFLVAKKNPAHYYRLVKVVHGAGVFMSQVINMFPEMAAVENKGNEDNSSVTEK